MRDTSRILYVLRCLQEKSDEQHPMTINQILDYLKEQGIPANRRTIPGDIDLLVEFGVDIITVKSTQNLYFVGERHFELPELKLLIDAALSSRFITPKKSSVLVSKLRELVSEHQTIEFAEEFHIEDWIKPKNENVYLIAEAIRKAINDKRQIAFKYYEYCADKSKVFKHNGYTYHLSPYSLIWNEDKYYVFGYSEKHSKIVKFRVDRMCKVESTYIDSVPYPEDFNLSEFRKQVFEMYDGKNKAVELLCHSSLMKVIIDKFGEDVDTKAINDEWFKVTAEVCVSPTFYSWLFKFTGKMVIKAPSDVVQEYKEILQKATENL